MDVDGINHKYTNELRRLRHDACREQVAESFGETFARQSVRASDLLERLLAGEPVTKTLPFMAEARIGT